MDLLGKNLKNIRKCWGESQLDLSLLLETEVSTISQWESGKRKPNNEMLTKISQHYQITIDDLLNEDLSEVPSVINNLVRIKENSEEFNKNFMKLLPIFDSVKEKENPEFLKALNVHKRIMSNDVIDISEDDWKLMVETYGKLFETGIFPSAGANLLSFLFLLIMINLQSPVIDELSDFLIASDNTSSKKAAKKIAATLLDNNLFIFSNEETGSNVKDFDESVLQIIEHLKSDRKYYSLADYYFALRYIYGIVDDDLSLMSNQKLGFQILLDLARISNEFALRYLKFFTNYLEN